MFVAKSIRYKVLNINDLSKYNLRRIQAWGVNVVKDILASITEYREQRGWTEYQLAERSGLPPVHNLVLVSEKYGANHSFPGKDLHGIRDNAVSY